jgi:acetaldehyde dehydrogenase
MTASVAVIGTGNIGTDLMFKLIASEVLSLRAMVGIDPRSDGLARARAEGIEATHQGVDWIVAHRDEIDIVFEATSARIHNAHAPIYRDIGVVAVDLTPAAVGPPVVPVVNLGAHLDAANVSLITCGGQATVPMVASVASVSPVLYAEIVSTVSSRSAGPGTRQNIDEFTQRTAESLRSIGNAVQGKAIIVLNPAEPPIMMRNTVYCALPDGYDEACITTSVVDMVAEVSKYVPGYRLRSEPLFDSGLFATPGGVAGGRVTILLEVEGNGDYLPPFAGNLDIMTAAAVRVGEMLAEHGQGEGGGS